MCNSTKWNVRVCVTPGCNHITHVHSLLCDRCKGLGIDSKEFTKDDQVVVTLNAAATSAFSRAMELFQPRTVCKENFKTVDRLDELNKIVNVISAETGIDTEHLFNYFSEIDSHYTPRADHNRNFIGRAKTTNWRERVH